MKYFAGFFLSLLFASNLFASNLCNSSCDLSITFPGGGSIEAIEPLTITFGDGGFIGDGVVITGYSAGDTLTLDSQEGIVFLASGSFELGNGGNVDYSNILIISNGVMTLAAIGGSEKISIQDMTLLGNAALTISSDFEIVESGSFHFFSGQVTVAKDLVFTNYGSFGGLSEFDSVMLSIEKETYDITESVLIPADAVITMASKEVIVEPAPVNAAPEGGSASGGFINLFCLSVMFLLLMSCRFFSIVRNKKY